MLEGAPGGHAELWIVDPPPDQGPEGNVGMWREAELFFDHLYNLHAEGPTAHHNEAVTVGLGDVYTRCVEERRRAEDLMKLHAAWPKRRIGGVDEPKSPVRDG